MSCSEECRFCNIFNGIYKYEHIDKPIIANDMYMAISSIGALVEGWNLVVPKEHMFSMASLYNSESLNDFVNVMIKKIKSNFGNGIIAFEHGANKQGSLTSCGTNHAHLHLVPYNKSLISEIMNMDKNMSWIECSANQIGEIAGSNEYLFYCDIQENWGESKGILHILKQPQSQFFRRVIAKDLNCEEEFSYKIYPRLDIATRTCNMMVR
jgi:diadenosine tetraphosphate (Ap4A) HIT family hydrolase